MLYITYVHMKTVRLVVMYRYLVRRGAWFCLGLGLILIWNKLTNYLYMADNQCVLKPVFRLKR